MAAPAHKPMEVEEFLRWNGEGDTRYQLRDGIPIAMAPPSVRHGRLAANLTAALVNAIRGKDPCAVQIEAGIRSVSRARSFHQADLVVSCAPGRTGGQEVAEPIVIVEVLSPSTADDDRRVKLFDHRLLPSVREIVLIDSRYLYAEVHRRYDGDRWLVDLLRQPSDALTLESIGLAVPMEQLYANLPSDSDEAAATL